MLKQFVIALLFSIVMVGCGERYGGPIFPVPTIPSELPAVPSESDVMSEIRKYHGKHLTGTIESEIFDVESRIYLVVIDRDSESPKFFKVTYYLLDTPDGGKEWVCVPEKIELL